MAFATSDFGVAVWYSGFNFYKLKRDVPDGSTGQYGWILIVLEVEPNGPRGTGGNTQQ